MLGAYLHGSRVSLSSAILCPLHKMQYPCASSGSPQMKCCSMFPVMPIPLLIEVSITSLLQVQLLLPPPSASALSKSVHRTRLVNCVPKCLQQSPEMITLLRTLCDLSIHPQTAVSSSYSWLEQLFIPLLYLHALLKFVSFTNGARVLKSRESVLTHSSRPAQEQADFTQ